LIKVLGCFPVFCPGSIRSIKLLKRTQNALIGYISALWPFSSTEGLFLNLKSARKYKIQDVIVVAKILPLYLQNAINQKLVIRQRIR